MGSKSKRWYAIHRDALLPDYNQLQLHGRYLQRPIRTKDPVKADSGLPHRFLLWDPL